MTLNCPLCGRDRSDVMERLGLVLDQRALTLEWHGRQARLSPQVVRLAVALMVASPRFVSEEHLIDALWPNDPNGGPLTVRNQIKVQVYRLRKALGEIEAPFRLGTRYGAGGYWLEKFGEAVPDIVDVREIEEPARVLVGSRSAKEKIHA